MKNNLRYIVKVVRGIILCTLIYQPIQAQNLDYLYTLIDQNKSLKAFNLAQKIEFDTKNDTLLADVLSIEGNALLQMQQPEFSEQAIKIHQKAFAIRVRLFGIQSLRAAYSSINLGNAYWENLKDEKQALYYYNQSLGIFESKMNTSLEKSFSDDDKFLMGNTQRIVAEIYLSQGDFKTAQKSAEKSVFALNREGGTWLFAARLTLGRSLYYNDKIVDAFDVLKKAEAMSSFVEGNRAVLYAAMADCLNAENTPLTNRIQALNLYQKASKYSFQTNDLGEQSKYLNKIGSYFLEANQTEKSLWYFKKAIEILPKEGFNGLSGTYLTLMGNAYRQNKQYREASEKYAQAIQKLTNFPIEKLGALTELAQTNFDQALQNGHWAEALQSYIEAIQHLEAHENQLSTPQSALILRGYFHALFGGIAEVYMRLGQAEQALSWAERGKDFLSKKQKTEQLFFSLKNIQKQLVENQRLLVYSFGRQFLTVFIVTNNSFYPLSIDTTGIENSVKNLFKNIHEKPQNGSSYFHQEAYFLYQKLMSQTGLQAKEELIIVPDGILYYLPFEVLLSELPMAPTRFNQYAYLIKNHSFRYRSSILNAPEKRQETAQLNSDILAFAPTSNVQQQGLEPLQHNEREVDLISQVWSSKILRGSMATKNAFRTQAPYHRLIHISTHGIPNGDYPERGFLAFSPDTADNGLFRMAEMDSIKLSADLVVLSACETAHGKYYGGEGLMSIAHAFLSAGAKNIVASLWQVNDSLTTNLMTDFYQNLKEGETVEFALQKAKMVSADGEKASIAHPYYWAAFIFSSADSTTVRFTEGGYFWQKIAGFLALIAAAFGGFRFWRNSKKY